MIVIKATEALLPENSLIIIASATGNVSYRQFQKNKTAKENAELILNQEFSHKTVITSSYIDATVYEIQVVD